MDRHDAADVVAFLCDWRVVLAFLLITVTGEPVGEASQRAAPRSCKLLRDVDDLQHVRCRLVTTRHRERRLNEAGALDGHAYEVARRERALRAMQVGHHLEGF